MSNFHARYAASLVDLLVIASVEYASEDEQINSNPFNDLLGRHEPQEYWGICKVVDGFMELLKYNFNEEKRSYVTGLLLSAFESLYGISYDPLSTIGFSIENRPISYSVRSRECLRIADHFLLNYT